MRTGRFALGGSVRAERRCGTAGGPGEEEIQVRRVDVGVGWVD